MRSQLAKCRHCVYYQLGNSICRIFNGVIDPDEPGCPHYSKSEFKCHLCGKPIVDKKTMFLEELTDSTVVICDACNNIAVSCSTCTEARTCDFETNPSTLPKAVQKQIRQGNTIMTTTVKNPARIAETCAKNCKCWNGACGREGEVKWCGNYTKGY